MSSWRVTKLRQNWGLRARVRFPTHNRHAIRDGQAERVVCSHEFCELDDRGARTNCNKKRTLGTRCTQLPPAQLPRHGIQLNPAMSLLDGGFADKFVGGG